jgi:hypothetical protein
LSTHRPALAALATAVLALTGLTATSVAPASAAPSPDRDIVNKMSGGRVALMSNSTGEGATAITLRDPSWKYSTESWETDFSAWGADEPNTYTVTFKNEAAQKCLQPSSATPARGTTIVVKTCDGSPIQKWSAIREMAGGAHTGWWIYRPMVNKDLAMTLNRYNDGSWDTLYLNYAQPTSDRLWRVAPNDKPFGVS